MYGQEWVEWGSLTTRLPKSLFALVERTTDYSGGATIGGSMPPFRVCTAEVIKGREEGKKTSLHFMKCLEEKEFYYTLIFQFISCFEFIRIF